MDEWLDELDEKRQLMVLILEWAERRGCGRLRDAITAAITEIEELVAQAGEHQ